MHLTERFSFFSRFSNGQLHLRERMAQQDDAAPELGAPACAPSAPVPRGAGPCARCAGGPATLSRACVPASPMGRADAQRMEALVPGGIGASDAPNSHVFAKVQFMSRDCCPRSLCPARHGAGLRAKGGRAAARHARGGRRRALSRFASRDHSAVFFSTPVI